ncbi:MAG: lysophospholipid acyltransferase family protein [Pseudomonadota bacterium]
MAGDFEHVPPGSEFGSFEIGDTKLNRAALRTLAIAGISILILLPIQFIITKVMPQRYAGVPLFFHKLICFGFNVKRTVVGERSTEKSILFVVNHVSWLDIPLLGASLPGSFVAKNEIADWGLFGTLARLQRTIFVSRERRTQSAVQRNAIVEHLREGHNVILFPEGTSSAGNGVLAFKSALFSVTEAARDAGVTPIIQPISLAYTDVNAIPLVRAIRHKISWVGDMEFLPHLVQVMRLSQISATVHFHEPLKLADFSSRKQLAQHCQRVVAKGVRLANSGRQLAAPAVAKPAELP